MILLLCTTALAATLTGEVRQRGNGDPIPATITVAESSVTADGRGRFSVELPDGAFIGPTAEFVWAVDRKVATAGLRLVFELRSVDLAGNVSEGAIQIDIDQPPLWIPFVSCQHSGGSAGLLAVCLAFAARRRREPAA